MNRSASLQHDTLVQTLYSGRCGSAQALYFDYALAQARADVFFSLLFGGRIVCSAGTFFDSPIAIRIFGELFSHERFKAVCESHQWHPLRLNTDNPQRVAAKDYLLSRWRDPKIAFGLFRETEVDFHLAPEKIAARKRAAAESVENGQYGRLEAIYEPFLAEHRVPRYDSVGDRYPERPSVTEPRTGAKHGNKDSTDARIPTILTTQFAAWLRSIMNYLSLPDCFVNMDADRYKTILSKFSPLAAVKKRTNTILNDRIGNYILDDLRNCNREFESVVGGSPLMNEFHKNGLRIYGHYYALVNNWIELDWHTTRHAAYGSSTCLLSSNWEARQVFDFDAASKIHYLLDTRIDDSLRLTQERFGELDWSILLDVVSDREWELLIWKIREATTTEEVAAAADKILNLLSRRITSFSFQSDKGRLSIRAKNITNIASHASAVAVCVAYFESSLTGLLGAAALTAFSALARLKQPFATGIAATVPGAMWLYQKLTGRALRTAVVPTIFIGEGHYVEEEVPG